MKVVLAGGELEEIVAHPFVVKAGHIGLRLNFGAIVIALESKIIDVHFFECQAEQDQSRDDQQPVDDREDEVGFAFLHVMIQICL